MEVNQLIKPTHSSDFKKSSFAGHRAPAWAKYMLAAGVAASALFTSTAFAGPDELKLTQRADGAGKSGMDQPFVKHLDHGPRADISPALYQKRIAEWNARAAASGGK